MEGGGRGGLTSVDLLRLEMKKLEKKESAMKVMAEEYKNAGWSKYLRLFGRLKSAVVEI